jgi:hypothetical protein
MKLRHKETGEIIDLPDYLPEYEDAREIARVFQEAAALSDHTELPPGIISLKTYSGDIIQVAKVTNTNSHFPYDKLIRIHLHLAPFTNNSQQNKSIVWSVLVNEMEWTVGSSIFGHVVQQLDWNKQSGWWAITEGIYAIHLEKLSSGSKPPDNKKKSLITPALPTHESTESASSENPPVIQMRFHTWIKRMIAN